MKIKRINRTNCLTERLHNNQPQCLYTSNLWN